jgi:serine/threonine protein kinase
LHIAVRPYNRVIPLALTPGVRLGVYEVTAQIGEGGMGQVYRARDTKLALDVAIKILPEAFVADPDRPRASSVKPGRSLH